MTKTNRVAKAAAAVTVRVLPQGDGRIFTGDAGSPFATYRRGEAFALAPAIALELEGRGLVEIQP